MPWWHRIALLGSAAASLEAPKLHPRAMAGLWEGCCMGVGVSQARRGRRLGVLHAVVLASSSWALVASTEAPRLDPRAKLGLWESHSTGLGATPARCRRRAVIRRVVASGSSMAVAASIKAPRLDPRARLGLWESRGTGLGVTPARRRCRVVIRRVVPCRHKGGVPRWPPRSLALACGGMPLWHAVAMVA